MSKVDQLRAMREALASQQAKPRKTARQIAAAIPDRAVEAGKLPESPKPRPKKKARRGRARSARPNKAAAPK